MRLTTLSFGAALGLAGMLLMPAAALAQQIRLELHDGRVTLDTTNAMPASILSEWARVGGTRIVDGDRLVGTPLTLKLEGVPERQALDIILRSAAGYIAATRAAGNPGVSTFDRIVVMPVSVNLAAARSAPVPVAAAPVAITQPMPDPTAMADGSSGANDVLSQGDDGSGAEQPASSTNFDYANPQRYFAARAAAQQRASEAANQEAPPVDPAAVSPGGFSTGTLLSTPGTIPVPPAPNPAAGQAPQNPYGLPAGVAPGSSTAPPMEPDRSKYINPYAPTPPPGD